MIKPHGSNSLNPLYIRDDAKRAELEKEAEGLPSLLRIATKSQPFVNLSILDVPKPQSLNKSLRKQHFQKHERLEQVMRRRPPHFPILLRPVRADVREQDWFVDNRDMRLIENWNLTAISSDSD